ncbi:hypothetical protein [Oceanicoccus sagamiensis]|uniref:STAS/SEC14 domain-containing protein n=1 Tax=Oceanicoccus sagamiensis TaxID=716816 RepID=A0A1X9NFW9_9GAMM|nr:hypothetical protein [Oceanicoccus sagamiensis]ARN74765.1 hypothetical protein BST96_11935 [Oceanicoccus sagamiensis]
MPIALHWETPSLLLIEYTGEVTGDEALDATLAMSNDKCYESLETIIVNGSALHKTVVSEQDIEKVAAVSVAQSKSKPTMKVIMIMGQDEASQSLAAFYQFLMHDTGWQIELVHTESEARERLNSP